MTDERIAKLVKLEQEAMERVVSRFADTVGLLILNEELVTRILDTPGFESLVGKSLYVTLREYPSERLVLSMYLSRSQDENTAAFVRALTTSLGVQGDKSQSATADSLIVTWRLPNVTVEVLGYKPPSCQVVEEEVVIPAQPEHIEKRKRLICNDDEGIDKRKDKS